MRVTLLMNFVAPYRVPLLEKLRDRVGSLRVLISTPMERDRAWAPNWGTLDVAVQRTLTHRRKHVYTGGFARPLEIHVPYDTLPQLVAMAPDALISGELGARSVQAALYRLFRRRMPLLIWATLSEHTERDWGWRRRLLRRFILRCADGVLVNGESGARYIARFGVPDNRIFRVNQPVDVALFARETRVPAADGVCRVLCSGLLDARKNVVPFAEALAAWCRDNPSRQVELSFVGDGDLAPTLTAMALPPSLRFRLLGQVPYEALPAIYARADVLAFPTLLDEWGLVVNEAMAAGLPVLGSRYGQAVEELITDGQEGWIFDPSSAESMRAAIIRAMSTPPAALAAMGAAARERIQTLTPQSQADRIAEAVRTLVSERQRRTPRRRLAWQMADRGRAP